MELTEIQKKLLAISKPRNKEAIEEAKKRKEKRKRERKLNMTQEDKNLLLKDLCARLPYKVKCLVKFNNGTKDIMTLKTGLPNSFGKWEFYNKKYSAYSDNFKPYLRSMSSMTEEEKEEYHKLCDSYYGIYFDTVKSIDYLNAHHFDYRGLIPKGLAIEVTRENNPYK